MESLEQRSTGKWTSVCLVVLSVAGIARADFAFGEPVNMGSAVNSPSSDYGACVSADGLELYFTSERTGGFGAADIWVSTRQSIHDPWNPPTNLGSTVNGPYNDSYPTLSSNGLTLYFSDAYSGTPRSGGLGAGDIWMTTRPSRNAPWGAPVNMGTPINSPTLDMSPTISEDGLILIFTSNNHAGGLGSWDLWMSTRVDIQDPWDTPVNLGPAINSANWEGECGMSCDGMAIFYGSGRAGIVGAVDIWMIIRKIPADPWDVAVNLGPIVNSSSNDGTARVAPDMRTLYFCSDRPGGFGSYDLFEVPIIPLVDLDGDGNVGTEDIVPLIEFWGQSDSTMDVGPGPWGDGIIDATDLEVFLSYWGQPVDDPTLIAHWPLDESEGMVVSDAAGENHAYVLGDALWQPDGGQIDGVLLFDGVDDFISAPAPLNPADGPFSVLAWVKGGAAGQAIISEPGGGPDWLSIDLVTGSLMTDLKASGRGASPLLSQTVITDGSWHRIGLVWDGSYRTLHVDSLAVAEDTQGDLESSASGLYIGCGDPTQPETFFSGLIDDVRIYNRVVNP